MSGDDSIVYVVDDDPSMCEALTRLLGTVGLRAQAFGTPEEFLKASDLTHRAALSSTCDSRD